jgi:hypothetical protein
MIDPNGNPVHAQAYTHPKSIKQSEQIIRLVDIGILGEDYSYEWPFEVPKKTEQ